MKDFRVKGLIIGLDKLKEQDKRVVILTDNNKIITAKAIGAAKPGSRKTGLLDPANYIKASLYRTSSWPLLKEGELLNDFKLLKSDLERVSRLFYVLEVIKYLFGDNENAEIFKDVFAFLTLLNEKEPSLFLAITALQIKLLDAGGYQPELSRCLNCQLSLAEVSKFSPAIDGNAGYYCGRHNFNRESFYRDLRILKVQKFFISAEWSAIIKLGAEERLLQQIFQINHLWLQSICEKQINSFYYFNE